MQINESQSQMSQDATACHVAAAHSARPDGTQVSVAAALAVVGIGVEAAV